MISIEQLTRSSATVAATPPTTGERQASEAFALQDDDNLFIALAERGSIRKHREYKLDGPRIIFYHKTGTGQNIRYPSGSGMTEHNMDNVSTGVRSPSAYLRQKDPARYNASVVIPSGFAQGMEYPITVEYTVIGRDKTADII